MGLQVQTMVESWTFKLRLLECLESLTLEFERMLVVMTLRTHLCALPIILTAHLNLIFFEKLLRACGC